MKRWVKFQPNAWKRWKRFQGNCQKSPCRITGFSSEKISARVKFLVLPENQKNPGTDKTMRTISREGCKTKKPRN